MWNAVRGNQLGAHFRRQHVVGSFVVDFACVTRRLVVEVDGGIHLDPDIAFADGAVFRVRLMARGAQRRARAHARRALRASSALVVAVGTK